MFGRRGHAQTVLGGCRHHGAGGFGNIIGGTDTPVTASVDPGGGQAVVRADIPAAPRFDATLFVSASSLNLRGAPSMGGHVLMSLPRNTRVLAGERRGGWVLVSRRRGR